MKDIEKMLEEVCNDHCEGCPMRKECEAYQAGAYSEKDEITAETLRTGMMFDGAGKYNEGEWLRITSICDGRVSFTSGYYKDSCDCECFPAIQNPDEWKFAGYLEQDEADYIIA